MKHRDLFVTTALVSGMLCSATAYGADLYLEGTPAEPTMIPAVSGVNGKLAISGGEFDDDTFGTLTGAISVPLGMRYGLQADGILGTRDGEFVGGGAAHLFWRDPTTGLLGLYGSYTHREDFDGSVSRLGVEAEYYWNNWTAKTLVGAEFVDAGSQFAEPDDDFFAFTDIAYYLNDDFEVSVGHRYTADRNALALGVEYQLDQDVFSSGVSLFAEGRIGEDDYQAVWGGIRVYFGDEKSLMRRHREDDPDGYGDEDLFDLDVELEGFSSSEGIG